MLVLLQLPVSGYIFCAGSALAHNLGQLAGAAVLLSSAMALGYAPVLLAAGLIVGGISCILSRALFAALPKQTGQQRQGESVSKIRIFLKFLFCLLTFIRTCRIIKPSTQECVLGAITI